MRQKTRFLELSCGFVCVILRLAVLVEHRLVTDTDRHRRTQAHSCRCRIGLLTQKPEVEMFWRETAKEYLISDGPILNFNFSKTLTLV